MPSNRRSQRYQNGGPPGDMSGQISHIQWRENRDSDQSTQEARLQHSSSEDNQQSDSAETQNTNNGSREKKVDFHVIESIVVKPISLDFPTHRF